MLSEGDIFEYIGEPWYHEGMAENIATYIIIDSQHAPIYKLMCMFDNTEMYEDEDRLTNAVLYRMIA